MVIPWSAFGSQTVDAIPYERTGKLLLREFALLQHRVYSTPKRVDAGQKAPQLHDPSFDVLSFFVGEGDRVIAYAGVAMKRIKHAGEPLDIGGLSCVMIDPGYQRQGIGSKVVAAATRCIERSSLDVGVFTCDPPLARFYQRAGAWPVAPDVVLAGSHDEAALRSDRLNKVVLLRLLSERAMALAFAHSTIDLDLPLGQFL
jgi:GNAT superfamily N-acetyltransferase